ncbi:DUF348 domain-containing protein [Micrococcales bacterium 31B]|nr:DUF348 domain-containing protein [Micrococcales bacterium 31B]
MSRGAIAPAARLAVQTQRQGFSLVDFMKSKPVRYASFGVIIAGLVGGVTVYNVSRDEVNVIVDGERIAVRTHARDVQGVLDAAGIAVDADDSVVPPLRDRMLSGATVTVKHARDLRIDMDGEVVTKLTTAETLGEAIAELNLRSEPATFSLPDSAAIPVSGLDVVMTGAKTVRIAVDGTVQEIKTEQPTVGTVLEAAKIVLEPTDIVSAPLDSTVRADQLVTITRVKSVQATSTEEVGFTTIQEDDPTKFADEKAVVVPGKPGVLTTTYTSITVNGAAISRGVLSQNVTTAPVQQLERKGTRVKPVVLAPGQVITSVDPTTPLPGATLGTNPDGTVSTTDSPTTVAAPSANAFLQNPTEVKAFAKQLMASQYGWGDDQYQCLNNLWEKESNWRWNADNPSSDAYGIPQSLPGSKMAAAGADWANNGATQVRWGLDYIKGRYGVPCSAWGHSQRVNWY